MARILAVVPARGGSKRLPRKNIMPLGGKPLIQWSVEFAAKSGLFTNIVVSSDDPEIVQAAQDVGALSHGLRPAFLASDTATTVDVLLHELDLAEADGTRFDYVALLQPTTPFRKAERWIDAIEILDKNTEVPSVIGVSPVDTPPFHMFTLSGVGELTPLFPDELPKRSQDLPMTVAVNGALYLVRASRLRADKSVFFGDSRAVQCDDPIESIDIDTARDFANAERMLAEI